MKKKIILGIVICAMTISFCGCSWTKSISDDDIKAIATYSAKMVAKYNLKQEDGVVYIDESDEDRIAAEKLKDIKKQQDINNSTTKNTTGSKNSTSNSTQTKTPIPLSTALGVNNVDFVYLGNEVKDRFTDSVYDLSPNPGNKFFVMKFRMTNTTGNDTEVNIISLNPKFKATLNGSLSATNDLTLVAEDLATYKGVLRPGESKELVLLFQFKNDDLTNITSTSLQCTVNGSTNDIKL